MPLLWLSFAFLLGLLLAAEAATPWWGWLAAALAAVGLGIAQQRGQWQQRWLKLAPLPVGFILAALLAGGMRWQLAHPPLSPADLAWFAQRGTVDIYGVVSEDFGAGSGGIQTLLIKASQVGFPGGQSPAATPIHVSGQLTIRIPFSAGLQLGDAVQITGTLDQSSSQNVSWRELNLNARRRLSMYLPSAVITGQEPPGLSALTHNIQRATRSMLNRLFPQPEAALLNGILLGYESDLPDPLSDAFKKTGTAHIIAISGFNMAILAGLVITFLNKRLPLRFTALVAVLVLAYYTILVGGSPSVVRAAIMAMLGLGGRLVGRRQTGIVSLLFSAAVMCLFNPDLPWSVSFQLSFGATLGLIWLADPMTQAITRLLSSHMRSGRARQIAGWVGEYFLYTLAAQVFTLPIMAVQFGKVSWMAILANPLILPVQPAVMVLGGLALLLGLIWLPLGQAAAVVAYPLAAYTNRMTFWLASLPGGQWVFPPLPEWVLTAAVAVVAVLYILRRRRIRQLPLIAVAASASMAILLWQAALDRPDGRLHIHIPEPAQGAAWWLETPGGQVAAINGGEYATQWISSLATAMPLMRANVDMLVVTRPDAGSLASLVRLMDRYTPEQVLWNQQLSDNRSTQQVLSALGSIETPVALWDIGQPVEMNKVKITPLLMSSRGGWLVVEQDNFVAVVGETGLPKDTRLAFPANISALVLNSIAYDSLTAQDWQRLAPQVVIWRSQSLPPQIAVPTLTGAVELVSDGERLWISAENEPIVPAGDMP